MSRMLEDYDHLLNIDPISQYEIEPIEPENAFYPAGRAAERLDGLWNFAIDVYDTFLRKRFFTEVYHDEQGRDIPVDCDFDHWEKIQVPSSWNSQRAEYDLYEGTAIYSRTFRYDQREEKERILLRIGAANHSCRIWLNRQLVARHVGGFTPFTVDITEMLRQHNRLILEVNNSRRIEQVPSVNYDWKNYGGVFREVELFRVPATYIKDLFVYFDGNVVTGMVELAGEQPEARQVKVFIDELGAECECVTDSEGLGRFSFPVLELELWDLENPKLCEVRVESAGDGMTDPVGFRTIERRGRDIYLNGRRLFLKGVCVHEEVPSKGRALTDEDRLEMISHAKEMGCTIIRLSHYPHSERMARLADRSGILLWEEIPVYWALCFWDDRTRLSACNQMKELIYRDRNRASVILWGIGNENPDTEERLDFMSELAAICRRLDPSRLTTAACLVDIDRLQVVDRLTAVVDVVAINEYYGWYYRSYEKLVEILEHTELDRPLVISETGADALAGHHGLEEELYTEEHQAKMYEKQLEMAQGRVSGFFPWILYDFRSGIRMNPIQAGYNRKGLISADRTHKKLAYSLLQRAYSQDMT